MSYLVYCIYRGPLPAALEIPDGLGGYRVFTANYDGLGVALSKLAGHVPAPDRSALLAYEKVVNSFYRHLTVVPMRYGCQVNCPYDAVTLLREKHDTYDSLLRHLEGLAEIGVQVVVDKPPAGPQADRPSFPPEWFPPQPSAFRTEQAETKKPTYPEAQRTAQLERAFVENLCCSLHGSFLQRKVEFASSQRSSALSLHFLVPRESVESFRQNAQHLPPNPCVKLLLKGPLPPYNFVDAGSTSSPVP